MPHCLKCNAAADATQRLMVGRPVEVKSGAWNLRPVEVAFCKRCLRRMNRFITVFSGLMLVGLMLGAIAAQVSIHERGGEEAFISLLVGAGLTLLFFLWQLVKRLRIASQPSRYYKAAYKRWHATEGESVFTLEEFHKLTGEDDE
ncbi:hypothetical protein K8R78_05385 [bacterium]|nr:hypothetical protein [bacterium]